MATLEEVRSYLSETFPAPDRVELSCWEDDSIYGSVVSTKFEGKEMIDRVNMLWDLLDRGFTLEDRRNISMIVTATPAEAMSHSA
jgi:hypothetical protein